MKYTIELKPRVIKDLKDFPLDERMRVISGIEALKDGLASDVKKLTNHSPEYRLRVGDYRILFELEGDMVIVYRIKHRKDAYR